MGTVIANNLMHKKNQNKLWRFLSMSFQSQMYVIRGAIKGTCVYTPFIRLVKFQLVRQIPDVYVSACVLAAKLFLLFFLVLLYFS